MNSEMPIINSYCKDMTVKYDVFNGTHVVYVALGSQVRRVIMPTQDAADSLVRSLSSYCRLKINSKYTRD